MYVAALDLNMGYDIIRLDPDLSKICTIIFPWGKYFYLRLPMGIPCSPDIIQTALCNAQEIIDVCSNELNGDHHL